MLLCSTWYDGSTCTYDLLSIFRAAVQRSTLTASFITYLLHVRCVPGTSAAPRVLGWAIDERSKSSNKIIDSSLQNFSARAVPPPMHGLVRVFRSVEESRAAAKEYRDSLKRYTNTLTVPKPKHMANCVRELSLSCSFATTDLVCVD